MRFAPHLSVTLASAVLYGWCFPPRPHPLLAWVALAPFLIVLRGTRGRAGTLFLAWLWTVVMAYTVNDWFPRAVSGYFAQPAAVGIGLFFAVSTSTAGIQYMGFALAYRRLEPVPLPVRPLVTSAAWVTADLARLFLFGGDPWALLGYSQVGVPSMIQIADATGVHGITFVVVAVNAAIAELWCAMRARRRLVPAIAGLGLSSLAALLVLAYGGFRLREAEPRASTAVPVGIVQAHLPLGSQWKREFYGRNLETYLRQTHDLLRGEPPPRLVVWPENSMTFFVADEPTYRRSIASVLEPFGAQLVAGGPQAVPGTPPGYLNSAFLIAPNGGIRGRYDKRLLLPFAEYFPFGGIDVLRRAFGRVREFTHGARTPLFATPAGLAGVMICNEGFFPEPAAERVHDGAQLLINLANDSWLADPKYSEPAFDMVALRAVEQRRWILRASTSGPSALIDPFGRVAERTELLSSATVAGAIEPRDSRTLYSHVGDAFAWACAVVALVASIATGRRHAIEPGPARLAQPTR